MSTNDTPTQDDCEVSKTTDVWKGPFAETDKYGSLTGDHYYKCRDCGREVIEGIDKENVSHRDGCRFGEKGNDTPQRHEPADFGGGESTGVQDL